MHHPLVRSALILMVAAIASPAFAVNIVTNPSFAGNMNGWSAPPSTVYDGANDATGIPGSGSAQSTFAASGASTLLSISQCIAAGPGNYTFGGKVLIPNGQSVTGSGIILVSYFSGPDCSTGFLNLSSTSTATTGSFVPISGTFTAPAGRRTSGSPDRTRPTRRARTLSTSTTSCSTTASWRPRRASFRLSGRAAFSR